MQIVVSLKINEKYVQVEEEEKNERERESENKNTNVSVTSSKFTSGSYKDTKNTKTHIFPLMHKLS